MFFNNVSKIGFAVTIKIEENIEEKINALPFLNVIIFQKNEKTVFIIIDIYFFSKVIKKTHQKKDRNKSVFHSLSYNLFQEFVNK